MSHDPHEGPEDAVLYDGCDECDERAASPLDALCHLDSTSFATLRDRMLATEYVDAGDRAERGRTDEEIAAVLPVAIAFITGRLTFADLLAIGRSR